MFSTEQKVIARDVARMFELVEYGEEDMHVYQDTAVDFLWENPFSGLFLDPGLGKTCISLTVIARLVEQIIDSGEDGPILVIAPLKVATQTWPNEIPIWEHLAHLSHIVIRAEDDCWKEEIKAAGRARVEEVKAFYIDMPDGSEWLAGERSAAETAQKEAIMLRLAKTPACMHIINRERVYWLWKMFGTKWPFKTVIVDESSNFKDYRTDRFKALKWARKYITRLHILTGTPAPESYLDLFAQIYLLDGGERFSRSIKYFRDKYFTYNEYKRKYSLRPGAKEEILKLIAPICLVMEAKDYLDLAEPWFIQRRLSLAKEQMDMYRKFEKQFVLELPSGVKILAENAADQRQKLLQLCSGAVYETVMVPDPKIHGSLKKQKVTHHVHDLKIEDLESLYEELRECGQNILVAYWFKSSLDRLKAAFPFAKTMDKEGKLLGDWKKGKIQMMFFHPASNAYGLNMQAGGHHLYLFDPFDSLELFLQLIRRLARQGQEYLVSIHMPRVLNTAEELVWAAQAQKKEGHEEFMHYLKLLRDDPDRAIAYLRKAVSSFKDDVFADEEDLL